MAKTKEELVREIDEKLKAQQQEEKEVKEAVKKLEDLKKLNALYRKYQKGLKAKYDLAPFNEPILQLERQSGKIEFYDKAISGLYTFEHTDGTHRTLTLKGFPKTMQFYGQYFKVWTCHEDFPFQIPQRPLVDAELFTMSKDKDLNDTVNYKAKELQARGKMIFQIAIAIAVIIGVLVLAKMLLPEFLSGKEEEVVETTVNTVRNITVI